MESHARSNAIIELGKLLVVQLELGDDLLAQWLAHDLAEHLRAVDQVEGEALIVARERCVRAILLLWDRRSVFPLRLRPFRALEPLMRTLASLDLEEKRNRFLPSSMVEAEIKDATPVAKQWLELSIGLDYTARVLIRYALNAAAANAVADALPWVELAKQASLELVPEAPIVQFVLHGNGEASLDQAEHERLRIQIEKLEAFTHLAGDVAAELRAKLSSGEETLVGQPAADHVDTKPPRAGASEKKKKRNKASRHAR